ncbi:hypothetical protein QTO30_01260 [Yoonia sp. GPGPB17]|uniref:hypothetical protein n=1 Tax=Yoonia sp. GPGPB17 TaxID=3026147 RepID=UPI0030BB5542
MSRTPPSSVFLQRASYRQRRIRDAARFIPFLGITLFAIPLAWTDGAAQDEIDSTALLYVFGAWVILIVLTAALSGLMRDDAAQHTQDPLDE